MEFFSSLLWDVLGWKGHHKLFQPLPLDTCRDPRRNLILLLVKETQTVLFGCLFIYLLDIYLFGYFLVSQRWLNPSQESQMLWVQINISDFTQHFGQHHFWKFLLWEWHLGNVFIAYLKALIIRLWSWYSLLLSQTRQAWGHSAVMDELHTLQKKTLHWEPLSAEDQRKSMFYWHKLTQQRFCQEVSRL